MSDITFVSPRYGADVVGGAEAAFRSLATRLSADGLDVTVLTTRAHSYITWENHFGEGSTVEDGVLVHRFNVDRPTTSLKALSGRLLGGKKRFSVREKLDWSDQIEPKSTALLDAVAEVNTGVLAFTPYLYWPTVRGVSVAKVATILHAAAQPEAQLMLPQYRQVFSRATALAHYTRSEQATVFSLFSDTRTKPQVVLGLPVEPPVCVASPEVVRQDFGLSDEPFALYLGRVANTKGVQELVSSFANVRGQGGKLVLAGPVIDKVPPTPGVICTGAVSEEQKYGLLAAAHVLVNPSCYESFSLVVIEAWLMGTAVLVNGWCGATREHCETSGGGYWYRNEAEFSHTYKRLMADAALRSQLAQAGKQYATSQFSWPTVRRRYQALLGRLV